MNTHNIHGFFLNCPSYPGNLICCYTTGRKKSLYGNNMSLCKLKGKIKSYMDGLV